MSTLEFVEAVTAVSAAWFFLSILLVGCGGFLRRAWGVPISSMYDVLLDFWMGWSLTILFLQVWHFVFPINGWAFLPLSVIALLGARSSWKQWLELISNRLPGKGAFAILLLVAVLAVAAHGLAPVRNFDTALYHLPAVRWTANYPVVPGLGNLHGRLATNSSFFLFGALLENTIGGQRATHLASGLLLLVLILQILRSAYKLFSDSRYLQPCHFIPVLLLPAVLLQTYEYASSLAPDGVIFVLALVISSHLLSLLSGPGLEPRHRQYQVFAIVVLATIGVTVKLSFVVFSLVAALLTCGLWLREARATGSNPRSARFATWTLGVTCLILVPWMGHGVLLSGYPAYPSTIGAFPVDWRVPAEAVSADARAVYSWARNPGVPSDEVLADWSWFRPWLHRAARDRDVVASFAALCVAGLIVVVLPGRRRGGEQLTKRWLFLVPSIASMGFWFATAPDVRFTVGPLWILMVGTSGLMIAAFSRLIPILERFHRVWRWPFYFLLGLAFLINLLVGRWLATNTLPSYPLEQRTLESGLVIYRPREGSQCGDAPLPCTIQHYNPKLQLRELESLQSGFRTGP
jgi:hypothetical protein